MKFVRQRSFFPMLPLFITVFVLVAHVHRILAQEAFDIVTDIKTAQAGLFAWSPDSQQFTFINTGLMISPTRSFAPQLPDPAWQTYNLTSHTITQETSVWPLQTVITSDKLIDATQDQFLYAAPNKLLFLYQQSADTPTAPTITDAAEIAIANARTGESLGLQVLSRLSFAPESPALVLWAATNNAAVFSTTSTGDEIVEALQIYHVSVISSDPLKVLVHKLNPEIDGSLYTTVEYVDDRPLAIAPAGDAVLLIGRPDPAATSNDTEGRLILWRPNEPTASLAIDTFDTEAICQAAFAPDAPTQLVVVLADGRLAQYDTLAHTVQYLNVHLGNGCMNRYFSPDGNWLAVPYNSLGQIAFLDIRRLSATGGTPLHPPMVKAGQSVILTDADSDGRAALTLDGAQSTDSDGNIVDYVWSLGAAPLVNNGQSVRLDLTREQVGTGLLFTLTITDNDGLRDTDSIKVTFAAMSPTSP
ncbi:MAG TPA: hypothetical protein VHO69_04895 [Phototrophicaceae bacterium]|nr:hypothetical protein [Phototrophicaceae bacterium]